MRISCAPPLLLLVVMFFIPFPLFPQDSESELIPSIPLPDTETSEIDWNQIHFAGISFQQNFKNMDAESGENSEMLKYSIQSLGLNYGNFSGSRLGFYSDLNLLIPFRSQIEAAGYTINSGFSVDYMGTVGWNLWTGSFGFLPFIGFHTQYTYLKKDPLDDNQSNHMLSVGIGTGIKFILKINEKHNIYAGARGSYDTIEFTNASYDSREIQLRNKVSYLVSIGYAYTAPTIKRAYQSEGDE